MKLSNAGHTVVIGEKDVFIEAHGRRFLVRFLTSSQDEANKFMLEHPETGLIDTDDEGDFYVANLLPENKD